MLLKMNWKDSQWNFKGCIDGIQKLFTACFFLV